MLPAAFARAIQANTRARLENIHVVHLYIAGYRSADPVGASPLITWLLQMRLLHVQGTCNRRFGIGMRSDS